MGCARIIGVLLAALGSPASGEPVVHLDGPEEIAGAIREGVARERPGVAWARTATAAELDFSLVELAGVLSLEARARGGASERRAIGDPATIEPSVRLAVLLIVERLDEHAHARAAPVPSPAPIAIVEPPRETVLEVDLGVGVVWIQSVRLAASAGARYRIGDLGFGPRILASGICCAMEGDSIRADETMVVGFGEGRYQVLDAAIALEALLALGAGYERVSAIAVDAGFQGPAAAETSELVSAMARAGVAARTNLGGPIALVASAGAQLHFAPWSIRLPPPYGTGKTPLQRGAIAPFFELALELQIY